MMQLRTMVLVAVTGVMLMANYAVAENTENAQVQKMKACNSVATQKGLKGADRQAFIKTCLSGGSKVAAPANPQQEKMKACNKDATAQGLKGDARKTFMSSCLSGK